MRALIMILILMDYVKKDSTTKPPCVPVSDCRACEYSPCLNNSTCIPRPNNYTCYCKTGYQGKQCDETSPTTVESSGSQMGSTPEATTTSTPTAANTHKANTTTMSTSLEGNSTASSREPDTTSTQNTTAPTTNEAEITFNSSTNGSTNVSTSATISSSTTEAEPSTRSEEATASPLLDAPKKSVPVSIAGSIGGIVLIAFLTIGLVILFRKRKRRTAREDDTVQKGNIHCNPAYDEHCSPSADSVSTSSKDSGFGKHDESMEAEMIDGEYNTLRLHFPVTNEQQDNTYNHIDGSLTADSTYSHISNTKDALFDNTYSHMSDVTNGKSFEPDDIDATYNHLGDSCSSKRKGKTEESRDETYNHAQMNHVRPTADQEDQDDNYSHINLSGLKAQMPNADEHRVDAQEPTRTNAENAKAKHVTKIVDKGKKQHSDADKVSTTTAEGDNNYEGHTYFVLESNTDQHPKQAPYDYAVVAAPEKDPTEFTVLETDTQHEYFVIEPTTELQ
ncbi:uncharacterized protein LOC128237778 [Mya arenaria]|uniref:uncharacterized protein LOC128237778 n=1 Tax=Mya arenaria TaxID=6604 RepID=UPI0022E3DEA4|nr:uncharacterized protein LOC128237778 [Mya arenaria]